ncbi:MAG: MBOAT family protein [Alphaproteobacteria bacterium]|nr:MBOAT family protein [Alphaproteobacteria bacterium]
MSFVSASFLGLYLLALIVRWGTGSKTQLRIIALLALSWVFYAWHVPQYIFLILFSTAVDYIAGRLIDAQLHEDASETPARAVKRRTTQIVLISIVLNLGLLAWFKYAGFLVTSANQAGHAVASAQGASFTGWSLPDIVLPIGISFYTFQSLSYTIDVYRGDIRAERNFLRFACYIAFFPQLVAGPIVRARSFFYQFDRKRRFHIRVFLEGSYLILRGLFLKLVIADNLGTIVDQHWEQAASEPNGLLALSLMVFFAYQLFCDFAGYSDIARGLAYQMGFRLPINFNAPFIATSFSDFWRRWHITLSQWMRDYVYIPLGGHKSTAARVALNLLLVMILSGLWHGANWTFLAWGGVLGLALLAERTLGLNKPKSIAQMLAWFAVVQLVWIFSLSLFRSESIVQAMHIAQHALLILPQAIDGFHGQNKIDGLLVFGWCLSMAVWLFHARALLGERTPIGPAGAYEKSIYAGGMLAAVLMMYSSVQTFIYFQF